MTNTIRDYAEQLADILRDIDDKRVMAKALLDAAAEAGINVKALRKVAKELTMDREQRAKRYADETDLEQMRSQLDLFNGVDMHDRRAAA
jgi:hypothetical protein